MELHTLLALSVQWCHIAAAILWAGGAAVVEIVIHPSAMRMSASAERALGKRLTPGLTVFFAVTGTVTITMGVLRGTLFGPIRSIHALATGYGMTFSAALVIAAALALLGALGIGRTAAYYYGTDALWDGSREEAAAERASVKRSLAALGRIQLAGFAAILICMLLMAEVFS